MSHSPVDQLAIFPDSEVRSSGEDRLQFLPIARSIFHEIERWKRPHHGVTIGIYGSWGSGKTSLMRLMQSMLEGNDQPSTNSTSPDAPVGRSLASDQSSDQYSSPTHHPYLTIWFSAWHYDKRDDVWIALLRIILEQVQAHYNWFQRARLNIELWWARKKLSAMIGLGLKWVVYAAVVWLIISILNGVGWGNIAVGATKEAIELALLVAGIPILLARPLFNFFRGSLDIRLSDLTRKSAEQDYAIFVDEVRRDFQTLLCAVGRQKTVVVFVDDLDRCSSDQVVPILEAVKQFTESREAEHCQPKNNDTDRPQIIFVIGADREAIKRAVESRYKQPGSTDAARKPQTDALQDIGKFYLEKIVQISIDLPHLGAGDVRGYVTGLLGAAAQPPVFEPKVVEFFSEVLPDNPRLIKRVLNTYLLMRRITQEGPQASPVPEQKDSREQENPWRLLPLLITLRYLFEPAYQQLWSYPNLLEDLLKIATEEYDSLEEITNLGCPAEQPGTALVEHYGFDNPELLTMLRAFKARFLPDREVRISPEEVLDVLQLDLAAQAVTVSNVSADILSGDPTRIDRARQIDLDAVKLWAGRLLNLFSAPDSALRERAMFAFARIASEATGDFNTAVELLAKTVLTESSDKNLRVVERAIYALIRMPSARAQEVILQIVARAASDLSLSVLALRGLNNLRAQPLTEQTQTTLVSLYLRENNPALSGEAKKLLIKRDLVDAVAAALAKAMA
jgi:hypothetical protein